MGPRHVDHTHSALAQMLEERAHCRHSAGRRNMLENEEGVNEVESLPVKRREGIVREVQPHVPESRACAVAPCLLQHGRGDIHAIDLIGHAGERQQDAAYATAEVERSMRRETGCQALADDAQHTPGVLFTGAEELITFGSRGCGKPKALVADHTEIRVSPPEPGPRPIGLVLEHDFQEAGIVPGSAMQARAVADQRPGSVRAASPEHDARGLEQNVQVEQ